jgi:surfeit locus 1 family protein
VSSRWRFGLITLVMLIALVSTLMLGRWQLARAAEKENFQTRVSSQASLPTLTTQGLRSRADLNKEIHRTVTLRGHWLGSHTVYLDNRQMNNKPGLYVVTPLRLEDSNIVILVQRGWVARNFIDRSLVPKIETPSGMVEIQGRIATAPSKLYEFAGSEVGLIRQNIDIERFSVEIGLSLLPISVQQTGGPSEGLLREWPKVSSGIETHYGYAFQWFALSALIFILYVWFQIVRRYIPSRHV